VNLFELFDRRVAKQSKLNYIEKPIKAEAHSSIYKMHKYFARRPHNVFKYLVEHYSSPNDILLDCFCGGGVTLVEGIALNRRVLGVDLNPLATFISECQLSSIPVTRFLTLMQEIRECLVNSTRKYFVTESRETGMIVDAKWFELTYKVICPICNKETLLANESKSLVEGQEKDGQYLCRICEKPFKAIEATRVAKELLTVTYISPLTGKRVTHVATADDQARQNQAIHDFDRLQGENKLWYPDDKIPKEWDRQQEDCLHRKGFRKFSDFFTKRTLLSLSVIRNKIESYKTQISVDDYKVLLFTFSSLIRETNVLTMSTPSWMEGRPATWTKHAYWVPNQFVEVNVIEYFDKRIKAIASGLRHQRKIIDFCKKGNTFDDLKSGRASHIIWCRSSHSLPVPDNSVDLVLTDPPYGSNIQYGELSAFWLVWLKQELNLDQSFISFENEAIVNRKRKDLNSKNYESYYLILFKIFREAHRVLKPNRPLVFTFNNKNARCWFAVIKAAVDAGFYLDTNGVMFQDAVENYKRTAHAKYNGSIHGDFIYTFIKKSVTQKCNAPNMLNNRSELHSLLDRLTAQCSRDRISITTSELHVYIYQKLIPIFVNSATSLEEYKEFEDNLTPLKINRIISKYYKYDDEKKCWVSKERVCK